MIGKTILHYKILSKLGEGGMGVVYKAVDTKLDRDVAIKFLPRQIAASGEERERFKIEAKAAAALNHANIATIYAIEESDNETFIAMECIKGQELKDRIDAGPLPIDDTLKFAIQMAKGLQIAHEAGVVHRDIKSSNIMLTERGEVKIMDFGLAKRGGLTKLTKEGTTLGTVAYMSPEQTRGDDVDHRSDIFSLGVLLFEMLTGQLPFKGDYDQAVTYSILNEDPVPVTGLRTGIPMELERIVGKCLEKNASDRFQSAAEVIVDLRKCQRSTLDVQTPTALTATPQSRYLRWLVPVAAISMIVLVYFLFLGESGPKRLILGRTNQITSQTGLELYPTISPDGNMIAYAAGAPGQMRIYVRQIEGGRRIALAEDVPGNHIWPQWSPDGRRIAFNANSTVYVIPALGGAAKRVIQNGQQAIWSPDGLSLAYVEGQRISIQSVNDGASREIAAAYQPHSLSWSPDGELLAFVSGNSRFVFDRTNFGNIASSSIWVTSVKGGELIQITDDNNLNVSPIWAQNGSSLLYVSDKEGNRDLYQLPFDNSGRPVGSPVRLTTGLDAHTINLSNDGRSLAYAAYTKRANIGSIPIPEERPFSAPIVTNVTSGNQIIESLDVSADGQWIAFDSDRSGNMDIYKMPLTGGDPVQLTTHQSNDFSPAWSPDGTEIAFHSLRSGNRNIYLMSAEGGSPQQLTDDITDERVPGWAPDGKQIVFNSDKTGRTELYVISREEKERSWGAPRQLTFDGVPSETGAGWSPDGQLIAYARFTSLNVISSAGGDPQSLVDHTDPEQIAQVDDIAWSPDGNLIYFAATDARGRTSFWSIRAEGGEPQLLVRNDDPNLSGYSWFETDGARFFFTTVDLESDVWVMDLITEE